MNDDELVSIVIERAPTKQDNDRLRAFATLSAAYDFIYQMEAESPYNGSGDAKRLTAEQIKECCHYGWNRGPQIWELYNPCCPDWRIEQLNIRS